MLDSLLTQPDPIYFLVVVFILSLLIWSGGYVLAARYRKNEDDRDEAAFGLGQAAIFGLIALILAFSFSFAADRFEQRRQLVVNESVAISTAYARIDLLPAAQRSKARSQLAAYAKARLSVYNDVENPWMDHQFVRQATALRGELWSLVTADVRSDSRNNGFVLAAESFDAMGDIADEQSAAINNHIPVPIIGIVILCTLLGAGLLGLTFGRVRAPNRALSVVFCIIFAATVYTIIDLDHPRGGLLHIDVAPLQAAISSMNE